MVCIRDQGAGPHPQGTALCPGLFKCPDLLFYAFCLFSIKREDFGDQGAVPTVDAHGGEAAGPYLLHHSPFNRDFFPRRRVIDACEHFHNRGIDPAYHRNRPLVGGGNEFLRGEPLARDPNTQPREAGLGKDNCVVMAFTQFPDPRVHIAPKVFDLKGRVVAQELGPAPGARCADDPDRRDRAGKGKEIGRRVAGEDRGGDKARGPYRGNVLHAVHSAVDLAPQDRIVKRPDKGTLCSDCVKGDTGDLVTLRADDLLFNFDTEGLDLFYDRGGLCERKPAAPGPDLQRHAAYPTVMVSRSFLVCAAERKFVSNWEGGRKIPRASIFCQNAKKAVVSHSLTSM